MSPHGIAYKSLKSEEKKAIKEARGKCELCEITDGLVIDHDHETGIVRGVLCGGCNLRIGWIERLEYEWVLRADQFLGSHQTALAVTEIMRRRFERMNAEWFAELDEVERRREELMNELDKSKRRAIEIQTHLKVGAHDRFS